eukprot:TRINITY_DN5803_c2_g1_i2.p1 TRINITY_DN5803_c2_g1~~TRINITY_DN5803_c2_g1_i2.p1  ORF type:complete len:853 (+),score=282.12 TRINITY_DN5803_c2_g1_i2:76-2559(+)
MSSSDSDYTDGEGAEPAAAGAADKARQFAEEDAAVTIQRVTRGHQTRKRRRGAGEAVGGGGAADGESAGSRDGGGSKRGSDGGGSDGGGGSKPSRGSSGRKSSRASGGGSAPRSSTASGGSLREIASPKPPSAAVASPARTTRAAVSSVASGPESNAARLPFVRELLRRPLDAGLLRHPALASHIDVDRARPDWGPAAPAWLRQMLTDLVRDKPEAFYPIKVGDCVTVASGYGTTSQGDEGRPHWGKHDGKDGIVQQVYNSGTWARVLFQGGFLESFKCEWLIRRESREQPRGSATDVSVLDTAEAVTPVHPLSGAPTRVWRRQARLLRFLKAHDADRIAKKEAADRRRRIQQEQAGQYFEKLERTDSEIMFSRTMQGLQAGCRPPPAPRTAPPQHRPQPYPGDPALGINRSRCVEVDRPVTLHPPPRPHRPTRLHALPVACTSPGPAYWPGVGATRPKPPGLAMRAAYVVRDRLEWGGPLHGAIKGTQGPSPCYYPMLSWGKGSAKLAANCRPRGKASEPTPGPGDYYAEQAVAQMRRRVPAVLIPRARPKPQQSAAGHLGPAYLPTDATSQRLLEAGMKLRPVMASVRVPWDEVCEGLEVSLVPQEVQSGKHCRATVMDVSDDSVTVSWRGRDAVRYDLPGASEVSRRYWADPRGGNARQAAEHAAPSLNERVRAIERQTHGQLALGILPGDAFGGEPGDGDQRDPGDDDVRREWELAVLDDDEAPEPDTPPQRPGGRPVGTLGSADRFGRDTAAEGLPGPGQYLLGAAFATGQRSVEGGRISKSHLGKRLDVPADKDEPDPHTYRPVTTLTKPASPSAICHLTS